MTERGSAVIIMLLLMLLIGSLTVATWPVSDPASDRVERVSNQLKQAQRGLIEYAVTYPQNYALTGSGPGRFPCPDSNGNGDPGPRCPALALGLLPAGFATSSGVEQRLLPGDAVATEPLLWVVAGPYRNRPAPSGSPTHAMILNTGTPATLALDQDSDVIGLVIAPGPPLSGQERGGAFHVSDYLEGENADGDAHFSRSAGNDRLLPIRWDDVLPLVERQVLAALRDALSGYATEHGHLPWLAALGALDGSGNLVCTAGLAAGWAAVDRYRAGETTPDEQPCLTQDATPLAQPTMVLPGWLVRNYWHTRVWLHLRADALQPHPVFEESTVDGVLASAGRPMSPAPSGINQLMAPASIADLLDHQENTQGDAHYRSLPGGNDQWLVLDGLPL